MTQLSQNGIALVQVLIISIVLSLLGLFISQTSKQQIAVASEVKESFEAGLKIQSAEAKVLHALLSHKPYPNQPSDDELVKQWNFHGQPFLLKSGVKVTLQDMNGLINLNMFNANIVKKMLQNEGVDENAVQTILHSISDWRDRDSQARFNGAEQSNYNYLIRNGQFQTLVEVFNVKGTKAVTADFWYDNFSALSITGGLNVLTTTEAVLKALIDDTNKVEQILQLRQANKLNQFNFYRLTGIEGDEDLSYQTGRKIKVTLEYTAPSSSKMKKQFIVEVRSHSYSRPIAISTTIWNS